MKKKELNSLRSKDKEELQSLLKQKRTEAIQVKVKTKVSKEKNLKHFKMLKREISQINTILTEKKLVEQDTEKKEKESGV